MIKRTAAVQTRIDYRTLCVLIDGAPKDTDDSISSIIRFYLETFEEKLIEEGFVRPLTIEEAISRIEDMGIKLKQLSNPNSREAKQTRRAISKERMIEVLKHKNNEGQDVDFDALAKEASKLISEE